MDICDIPRDDRICKVHVERRSLNQARRTRVTGTEDAKKGKNENGEMMRKGEDERRRLSGNFEYAVEAGSEVTHDDSDTSIVQVRLIRGQHVVVREF